MRFKVCKLRAGRFYSRRGRHVVTTRQGTISVSVKDCIISQRALAIIEYFWLSSKVMESINSLYLHACNHGSAAIQERGNEPARLKSDRFDVMSSSIASNHRSATSYP